MRRAFCVFLLFCAGCRVKIGGGDRLFGKSGEQYFAEAKQAMDQGDWIAAATILTATTPLHAAADRRKEPYVAEWKKLSDQVYATAKERLPMQVQTDPPVSLYNVQGVADAKDAAVIPKLNYVHPPALTDPARLNALAEQLHAKLVASFPGLKAKFPRVVYSGFAEPPSNPARTYERWGTVIVTATGRAEPSKK
jgi:hypothetical protein